MRNIYHLLIKGQKEKEYRGYGFGDMPYIIELLDDYLNICKMYNQDSVEFKVLTNDEMFKEGLLSAT